MQGCVYYDDDMIMYIEIPPLARPSVCAAVNLRAVSGYIEIS